MRLLPLAVLLSGCGGQPATPAGNVVLITLDTVRADHLGAYGHADARTPVIDQLAREGVLFEQAVSVSPVTLPTHASILTGLYPHHHGVRNNGSFRLDQDVHTLAESFGEAGYDTAAVVSALVLDSKFALDQGFRLYDDDLYAGPAKKLFMFKEVPADVTVDKAIDLVGTELVEPFFLWVHLFDAHADYEPPPPYDVMFLDQPYDGEIAFIDKQLGRLFSHLKQQGLWDRTTVVLTADHGDSLGEHGEQTHGIFVYQATTHVPLVVRAPGVEPARVPGLVSQVDLAPTLADLVGLEGVEGDGISLGQTLRHGRSVPERDGVYLESLNPLLHFGWHELRAVVGGGHKLIEAPTPELYDLGADPGEQHNLWEGEAREVAELSGLLARWTAGDDPSALQAEVVDRETVQMLEALGYTADLGKEDAAAFPDPKDVAHRWVDLQVCQAMVRLERDDRAVDCLRDLIADDPLNWTARMSLAGVLRRLGRAEEALELLQATVEDNPGSVKTLLALAQVHASLGQDDEAVAALHTATEIGPADPEPWAELGKHHQAAGRPDEAVRAYSEALRRDEIHVEAYVGLANTFHRSGHPERALAYLDAAVEIEPTNLAAWYNLGVVQDHLGRAGEAERAYRAALELDPHHAMSHNNLGSLLDRLDRDVEAERQFRLALAAEPGHVEATYNLATLLVDDRPEVAVSLLRDVVARQPDLVPARHNLAVALKRLGRPDEALEQYAAILERDPDLPSVHLAMAAIEAELGRGGAARRSVALAIEVGGEPVRERVADDPALQRYAPR